MSNPFDQFDEPQPRTAGRNPFDQFDEDAPRTNLFSLQGAGSLLRSIGPNIARGIMGAQLESLEEIQRARDIARAAGKDIPVTPDEELTVQKIREKQLAIGEIDADLARAAPNPSTPLEVAQGVISSVTQNAPGVGAAVLARGTGITGAAPAIQGAANIASGQSYATERGIDPATGQPKTMDIEQAQINARVQGVTEGAFELLPTAYLVNKLGKVGFQKFIGDYLVRELGTELPTTAANKITEWSTVDQEKPIGEFISELKSDLIMTGLVTPFAAGATGAMAHGITRAGARKPAEPNPFDQFDPDAVAKSSEKTDLADLFGVDNSQLSAPFDYPSAPLTPENANVRDAAIALLHEEGPLSAEQIEAAKKLVADYEIEDRRKKERKPSDGAKWASLVAAPDSTTDLGELHTTQKSAANAVNYPNPNTGSRLEREFSMATIPEAIGKRPVDFDPRPGTYVLGRPTADRSEPVLRTWMEAAEDWRQKFLPESTLIISNEGNFSGGARGWYYSAAQGQHIIVPAALRNMSDPTKFEPNTLVSSFYTLTHEFGHAILVDKLFEGVDPVVAAQARFQSKLGPVGEDILSRLDLPRQALIREYNALRQRIDDNTMTAQEFIETWYGPGKLGQKNLLKEIGVAPAAPAKKLVEAVVDRALKHQLQETDPKFALSKQELMADYLSLDEYGAEQVSREAYAAKWDESAPESTRNLYAHVMKGLRDTLAQFFKHLKATGGIRPGVAFSTWLNTLPRSAKGKSPKEVIQEGNSSAKSPSKKAAPKAAPPKKPSSKSAPAKVARVQHNTTTEMSQTERVKLARKHLAGLIQLGDVEPNSMDYRNLNQAIKEHDWDGFVELSSALSKKKVKFELNDLPPREKKYFEDVNVVRAGVDLATGPISSQRQIQDAIEEWKKEKFNSRFFRHWFGDWQKEPHEASKIRVGALDGLRMLYYMKGDGALQEQMNPNRWKESPSLADAGPPLVLYHATRGVERKGGLGRGASTDAFTAFRKGAFGFHFGTPRAAHNRLVPGKGGAKATAEELEAEFKKQGQKLLQSQEYNQIANGYIIPVVLNIRNPLYVGEEADFSVWESPWDVLNFLYRKDLLTLQETEEIRERLEELGAQKGEDLAYADAYDLSKPLHELLLAKGFDGIVYENIMEGDTSYIAFHPNQVKTILGTKVFSNTDYMHLDLDFPQDTNAGNGAAKIFRGMKDFVPDPGMLKRSLKKFLNLQYHVFQTQQLAHLNPTIVGLVEFGKQIIGYNTFKSLLQVRSDAVVADWKELSDRQDKKVTQMLFDERDGGVLWWDVKRSGTTYTYEMNERTRQEFLKRGVDVDTTEGAELAKLVQDTKNALMHQLTQLESALMTAVANRYLGASPEVLRAALLPIKQKVDEIRYSPFFPQGRFGNMLVTVARPRADGKGNDIVYREAFESREEWLAAWKKAEASKQQGDTVQAEEKLRDDDVALMSLPADFLDLAATELDLQPDQVERLRAILSPAKIDRPFTKFDEAKSGLKGYSTDAMRSFANFTWHNANLIAKLKYRSEFNKSINSVSADKNMAAVGGPAEAPRLEKLTRVEKYLMDTRDYMMAPAHEAQFARAFVSILYLGLNVKTALMNTWGLITTLSDLTTKHGVAKGTQYFWKGVKDATRSMQLTNLNERREGTYLDEETQKHLDRAIDEGVISQSYAYHLAGIATSKSFRMWAPSRKLAKQYSQHAVDASMWTFRLAELWTRRVTFLAELQSAKEQPGSMISVYDQAVQATNLLQNEYSHGNRVPFMRGGAFNLGKVMPLATIFMSFAQHMAFHSYGGYELGVRRAQKLEGRPSVPPTVGYTMRVWVLLLLAAGYEGLPGAENLLDLIEIMWRWFGQKKPMRQELREMIKGLGIDDPAMISRGLGHNVAGFDLSRSIGMGRLFPGTDVLSKTHKDPEKLVGQMVFDMFGPAGGLAKWALDSVSRPWDQSMQRAPGGLGNIFTSYAWAEHGVRTPWGSEVTHDLETGQLRDLNKLEIAGKVLGFQPTIVSHNRELMFSQWERKVFWTTQKQQLKEKLWDATWKNDPEGVHAAREAITEYNSKIIQAGREFSDMRINPREIHDYLRYRRQQKQADEAQTSRERKLRQIYENVKESY